MNLNLGMMVDGNSRFAFVESLMQLGLAPVDLSDAGNREAIMPVYLKQLKQVYVRNAHWCIELGESLLSRVENSDYVVFVYNVANRARGHFSSIDNAICEVGAELVDRLGQFGSVCLLGPEKEKKQWKSMFPDLQEVSDLRNGNRSVIITGYQQEVGGDERTRFMRPLDYFIRSTQMRFSGMYLPALSNTQLVVLSHVPYFYRPEAVVDALLEETALDEEHDELNVYSQGVYDAWVDHYLQAPSLFLSSNARPPRVKEFIEPNGNAIETVRALKSV